jgi:uncharacterized protein YacL
MKADVLIIRIGFVLLLALGGFLLNPFAKSTHLSDLVGDSLRTKQLVSALFGALIGLSVIVFEVRARKASLKTLIGAAIGSTMGIVGAYLIGMLISTQDINTVPGEMKVFMTIALAFFMGYIGLMVGAAKGEYIDLSVYIGDHRRPHRRRG